MAGPNLEVFKFGVYLFFPIAFMFHFADPAWYEAHVEPYKKSFWPAEETLHKPPKESSAVREKLEELKAERRARREALAQLHADGAAGQPPVPAGSEKLV